MDTAEAYRTVRARLIDLAAQLTDEQGATPVPALPAWTVKDTYAHLTGVSADVATGELRGRATDDDTARQVAQRKERTFAQLAAEWTGYAPTIDALMSGPDGIHYGLMTADVWNHEQDVRGALRLPVERTDAACTAVTAFITGLFDRQWRKREDAAAVHFSTASGGEWRMGAGDPVLTLRSTDYEVNRLLTGRRSRAQVLALDWVGDVEPHLDRLHLFALPLIDLAE